MTNLKIGDIVSWNGDSWIVIQCGLDKEPLDVTGVGGWLADIENDASGIYTVLESEVTVTAWAPEPVVRVGDEDRPT